MPILSLSGGNQQKALFARALGSGAKLILMVDPMRGVDVGTKQDVYAMIAQEAAQRPHLPVVHDRDGRALHCDRVYVFHDGRIVSEIAGRGPDRRGRRPGLVQRPRMMRRQRFFAIAERLLPIGTLVLLLGAIFWQQPRAMSYFGVNLLLNLAVPIIFATMAQMMVIAINDLDLSIGPYVSLVACLGSTLLATRPFLGVACIVASIAAYAAVGALIELRRLPSIVVTLGLSFVWAGLAVTLLPTPGGMAPGLAVADDAREASARGLAGLCRGRHVADRLAHRHAVVLRRHPARRRRERPFGGAGRLVAARHPHGGLRPRRRVRHAVGPEPPRAHHLRRRQYRGRATR